MPSPVSPTAETGGLSSSEARARRERAGPNVLPEAPPTPWWRQLTAQLVHFFALMLWVAGGLAFIAGTPQLGVAIYVVIVINGLFSFFQERRAEHAAARLRDLIPRSAVVIRDGQRSTIDAIDLVVGDLMALAAGDRISADIRITERHAFSVDASTLTGESQATHPDVGEPAHAGTYVIEGEALGVVTACGSDTELGHIALLTRAGERRASPLALELHRVVSLVAKLAVVVGLMFFGIALLLGIAPASGFVLAVGVTVALVPEGLLPTVTLALAVGAQRMAERNALVRHLESVETLGSTTFICTDKTGTLTRNQMEVVEVWSPTGAVGIDGPGYQPIGSVTGTPEARRSAGRIAATALACSTGRAVLRDGSWVAEGDPMEAAIDALAQRLSAAATGDVTGDATGDATGGSPGPDPVIRRRFPFDPRRKRMSVLTDREVLVKGAPESVLALCDASEAHAEMDRLAERGLRVLAVAARPAGDGDTDGSLATIESGLTLLGLLAFEDLPRDEVTDALIACRRAGIKVAMVTGDHPRTALAIGRRTGLALDTSPVLEEANLPADDDELGAALDHDGAIIARVRPETKLRIARVLQERGHVVAMTGDGVNDGPALQQADIGIAMGASGTDVAREASDLVLLDDDFATIVVAIEHGRATFANIRRFLTYHLTDNVAELTPFLLFALSAGHIPLALTVLQILCLDIGTDLLPALALGAEPPADHVLDEPPMRGHLIDRSLLRRVFLVLGPAEAIVEMSVFFAAFLLAGWRPGAEFPTGAVLLGASGAAFACVVVGQAANAFACRSASRPAWRIPWRTNRFLPAAVAIELAALVGFLAIPPVADLLDHAPPPAVLWPLILLVVPVVLGADALHKHLLGRSV